MPKYAKGSVEMKLFMEKVRSAKKKNKKGDGFFGDVLKSVGKTALSHLPVPDYAKNIVNDVGSKVIDYGVSKTGLGLKKNKKNKYGSALLLP